MLKYSNNDDDRIELIWRNWKWRNSAPWWAESRAGPVEHAQYETLLLNLFSTRPV